MIGALGLLLSVYSLYVEHSKSADPTYEAMCDLSARITCSKVFTSEYGKLLSKFGLVPNGHILDVPNALLGAKIF